MSVEQGVTQCDKWRKTYTWDSEQTLCTSESARLPLTAQSKSDYIPHPSKARLVLFI